MTTSKAVKKYLSKIGKAGSKAGASKGGKASADALTPEQRVARAKKAVAAREAKRKGNASE